MTTDEVLVFRALCADYELLRSAYFAQPGKLADGMCPRIEDALQILEKYS